MPFINIRFLEKLMKKMTTGEFRNAQYNEVMKLTGFLTVVALVLTIAAFWMAGYEQLLDLLTAFGKYPNAVLAFVCFVVTVTFGVVFLMTREQAKNKLWLPTENGPDYDYRTQGVINE